MPPPDATAVYQSMIPKYGGLANMTAGIAQYIGNQYQNIQALQLQQAQDLSKFKTLDQVYYGGQHGPQLDALLSQNPYGRALVSRNQGQGIGTALAGQGGMGTPGMGMNFIGMPGASPTGASVLPNPSGRGGASPSGSTPSTMPSTPPSGPVITGQSVTQKAFEPPSFTTSTANPQGEAAVKSATTSAGDLASAQTAANIGSIRDMNQLQTMAQSLKNLIDLHEQLSNSKVAGILPAAGDVYGSTVAENAKYIPQFMQGIVVPQDVQDKVGRFVAARNESLIKSQPILTQQYGQAGSVRIMDSILGLAKNELGDLSTPHTQFVGQGKGTLGTLYRIGLGSQQYAQDLAKSGQPWPADQDEAAQEIYKRMPDLTDAQQKQLDSLVNSTIGNSGKPQGFTPKGVPGQSLPQNQTQQGNAQPQQKQQTPLSSQTAMQILQAAGGDKNKARLMAKNMGYSF